MYERCYYVYIMTNQHHTVLYTGITNNIINRWHQHATASNQHSFTAKYQTNKLVYYESFGDSGEAIFREKQIKGGSRSKKIALIERLNPQWKDLSKDFF